MAGAEWLEPQMLERFVNAAATGTYDVVAMTAYITLLVLTAIPVLYWWRRRLVGVVIFDLEQRMMRQLIRLDQSYFDRHDNRELLKHLGKGVGGTVQLLHSYFATSLLVQVPLAIMAAVYIASYSITVLVILILFLGIYVFVGARLGKHLATIVKDRNELDTVVQARREEMAAHMPFLQLQRATEAFYRRSRDRDERDLVLHHRITWTDAIFRWLSAMVQVVSGVLLALFFLPAVVRGDISVGTFFALYIYMNHVVQPALSAGEIYAGVQSAWAETKPLADFFHEQPMVIDREGAVPLLPLRDKITLASVSFAYPGKENESVLRDVSVMIPKGKMTAIVGESGGGKSTLAKLLLRQYDPTMGEIRFDDQPVIMATLVSVHERVAYMPQKPPLFSGSIRDNVDLRGDRTDDAVMAALTAVQAQFVASNRDLDRPVGELSGGQQQRIALARLLLQGADVVVLDEATASLDGATERGIVETFEDLRRAKGLTQVVIAHRLSTVMHADQIIVMAAGQVAAVGTHEKLARSSAIYQDLMQTFVRPE